MLWQKRLEYAETQEVNRNTQEISDYLRWLVNSLWSWIFFFQHFKNRSNTSIMDLIPDN